MNELYIYGILVTLWILFFLFKSRKINFSSVFSFLFLSIYGYAYIVYQINNHNVESSPVKTLTILLILFVIFFNIGNIFFSIHKKNRNYEYGAWMKIDNQTISYNINIIFALSIIILVIIWTGLLVYGGINSLMTVLTTPMISPEEFNTQRLESGVKGWIAPFYGYAVSAIGRFIAFLFLAHTLINKKKINIIYSGVIIFSILIGLLANLSKSSAFIFLFQLIFLYTLITNIRINFRKGILLVLIFTFILILIYVLVTGVDNFSVALDLIVHRIFREPIRVLNLYTEHYPDFYPHTYGMNIRWIHSIFGSSEFVPSEVVLSNGKGTVNSIFIGDAWVDFSYLGVVVESFFLGIYLSYIDEKVFSKKNMITKAMFATMILGIVSLQSIALLACMITFGLMSVPILSYIVRIKIKK